MIHTIEKPEDRQPVERRRKRNDGLTPREREVLIFAARGLTAEQTSVRLGVAPSTVTSTRKNAIGRLGAVCLVQALALALRRGYLTVDQL